MVQSVVGVVALLPYLCLIHRLNAKPVCNTICLLGQKCEGLKCIRCEEGFYNDNDNHEDTNCKMMSERPGPNYVLSEEGTAMRDRKWVCKEGCKEEFVSGWNSRKECYCHNVRTSTTALPSVTRYTHLNTTTQVLATSTVMQEQVENIEGNDEDSNTATVLTVSFSLFVTVAILGVIICHLFWYKKKRGKGIHSQKKSDKSAENGSLSDQAGTTIESADNSGQSNQSTGRERMQSGEEELYRQSTNGPGNDETLLKEPFRDYTHLVKIMLDIIGQDALNNLFRICAVFIGSVDDAVLLTQFLDGIHKWEKHHPSLDILDVFKNIGMDLHADCFDSREYRKIERDLKGMPPETDEPVEGELIADHQIIEIFTFIFTRIGEHSENFLGLLEAKESFRWRSIFDQCKKSKPYSYIECGYKWVKWHTGSNHKKRIKRTLNELDLVYILQDESFKQKLMDSGNEGKEYDKNGEPTITQATSDSVHQTEEQTDKKNVIQDQENDYDESGKKPHLDKKNDSESKDGPANKRECAAVKETDVDHPQEEIDSKSNDELDDEQDNVDYGKKHEKQPFIPKATDSKKLQPDKKEED